ncbi:protein of unknown function (plasmid) [Pararobbsia alpina]
MSSVNAPQGIACNVEPIPRNPPSESTAYAMRPERTSNMMSEILPTCSPSDVSTLLPSSEAAAITSGPGPSPRPPPTMRAPPFCTPCCEMEPIAASIKQVKEQSTTQATFHLGAVLDGGPMPGISADEWLDEAARSGWLSSCKRHVAAASQVRASVRK